MTRKAVLILLAAAALARPAAGADFSLLVFGQLARAGGGDLNRTILGLRDWCADRDRPPASFDCTLDPLRWFPGGGAALQMSLTPRLSLGIGAEILAASRRGEIRTDVLETESGILPDGVMRTATLTERTSAVPEYNLRAVPITAFAAWTLPISSRLSVVASAGAGICFGTLRQNEAYEVATGSEEVLTGGGPARTFTSDYFAEGAYREKTTAVGLSAFAGLGFEWELGGAMSLTAGIAGRRAAFGDWRGTGRDDFDWELGYGEAGERLADAGHGRTDTDGRLWFVESADPRAAAPYPRLILSDEAPAETGAVRPRAARISLDGLSFRIGVKFAL